MHRLHPVLKSSRLCQAAIEQVPMVAFRRPKNLKDISVHSEMKTSVTDKCSCRCRDLLLQKILVKDTKHIVLLFICVIIFLCYLLWRGYPTLDVCDILY